MLTLRRLLAEPSLDLTLLVDPGGPTLDRELLWLHTTELPDPSAYVRAGELVLTNGMWCEQTTYDDFVDAVRRADGAGIVYGLRTETPSAPPELTEACRGRGLPLATISTEVPFAAMTKAAAAILAEHRVSEVTGSVRRGGALASVVSRGLGAKGIIDVVQREHELPLVVVDRTGRELAPAPSGLTPTQLQTAAQCLIQRPPPLEVDLDGTPASVFLVTAVGGVDAALLCLRPYAELAREQLDALTQACTYLSLEVAKRQAVHAIEQRFAGELLDMVQAGRGREADTAARLRAFGLDPDSPIAAMAVWVASSADQPMPDVSASVNEVFVSHGLPAVVAAGTSDAIAFVRWTPNGRSLIELAEEVRARIAALFPSSRVLVGIGGVAEGPSELRDALVRARETCRAMQLHPRGGDVQAYASTDSHRLLLGMADREELARFAATLLDPIREHDRGRAGELEATLRMFLDLDGHYNETAERLHVHVNTLRGRLARLTEITGRDLRRTKDRVDFFLALEADAIASTHQSG